MLKCASTKIQCKCKCKCKCTFTLPFLLVGTPRQKKILLRIMLCFVCMMGDLLSFYNRLELCEVIEYS